LTLGISTGYYKRVANKTEEKQIMKRQAKYHGEIGANGKAYQKGQFIAEQPFYIGRAKNVAKSKKQEIAPYVWEIPEDSEMKSIFKFIQQIYNFNYKSIKWEIVKHLNLNEKQVNSLVIRYENGERWFFPNQEIYL
jgi:hypothetical protein